jgi:hypothetical protein
LDSITCAHVRNVRFCVRLCPVVSGHVQSCPLVSGNGCYPSPGDPFSHNPALHQSLHSTLHLILLEFLTPNASITFLGKEDRHLPVRHGPLLASTMCRTLGQKNGILKSRTDMFSYPMRRGWGSSRKPTGQGQVPGALKGVTCRFRVLVVYEHTNSNTCLYTNNA